MTTPTPTLTPLGLIMEDARKAMGLHQNELADMMGVSRWTLNRVINGHAQLQDEWIDLMPMPVREPVIRYLQQMYLREADRLNERLLPPSRIRRPTGAAA